MNKKLLLIIITLAIAFINSFYSKEIINSNELLKLQNTGIDLYKNNNNKEAKDILLKAKKLDYKNGKTNYFLGNVLMNLSEYNKAIESYNNSINSKYEVINSRFNISCAFSLLNTPESSIDYLLKNYREGDKNISRINNDPDLNNFRKSIYYEQFLNLIKFVDVKDPSKFEVIPKTGDEIKKYIFLVGSIYCPDPYACPSPSSFDFKSNGTFSYFGPGGWGGSNIIGEWSINESKKELIIKELGAISPVEFADKSKPITKEMFYNNNPKVIWRMKHKQPIIDIIPFSKIKLNSYIKTDTLITVFNQFGDLKSNKIIKYKIGKTF